MRIGEDSINTLYVMENHDEAYAIWLAADVKQRTLIHIDAHHDLYGRWSTPESKKEITIANYLFSAFEAGIVEQMVWVVPDQSWSTPRYRKAVQRAVQKIVADNNESRPLIRIDERRIRTTLFNKPLTVCTLADLPSHDGSVLLDIDVDFLTTPNIAYQDIDIYGDRPWCWPHELLACLSERNVRSDLVTIAYSVEGSYTPLQWKYLGDELAQRLRLPNNSTDPILQGTDHMRAATLCVEKSDLLTAEQHYFEAQQLMPSSAAPMFHLAHLCAAQDRHSEAQEYYRHALLSDPSYRTAFNSPGIWYYSAGRYEQAMKAHQRSLLLDADDGYAHLGLAMVAVNRKLWAEAEGFLRRALNLGCQNVDVYRLLGLVLEETDQCDEAISAYERTLRLAMAGSQSVLDGAIISSPGSDSWSDPWHAWVHIRLASLYARRGDTAVAIDGFRIGIAFGGDGFQVRCRLVGLYWRQRKWKKAGQTSWHGILASPVYLKTTYTHIVFRLRRQIQRYRHNLQAQQRPKAFSLWS